jgi:hypothetical protein
MFRRVTDIQHLYEQKTDVIGNLTFGPVQHCSDTPEHFQVELDLAKWVHQDQVPIATTYFQIEQGKNSFTMLAASDKADQRCGGGDLMRGQ